MTQAHVDSADEQPIWKALNERCQILGVPIWHCDATGIISAEPQHPAALHTWLCSATLRSRVAAAARVAIKQGLSPESTELFSGCKLLFMPHVLGTRCTGMSIAMALHESAMTSPQWPQILKEAGLDPKRFAEAIRPFLRRDAEAATHLEAVLRWTIDELIRQERDARTLTQFSEKLVQAYEEANMLFRFARSINNLDDPVHLMHFACIQLKQTLPFEWVAIVFKPDQAGIPSLGGRLIVAGQLPCPREAFAAETAAMLNQFRADNWTRLLTPDCNPIAALVQSEVLADPISHDDEVVGVLMAGNKQSMDPELSSAETQLLDASADFLGVFHENLTRFAEQKALFTGTVQALTAAIDAKDRYTCGHSERVALLARTTGEAMGLTGSDVEQFQIGGLVHDVGKIGVPEAVLCKPARLTDAEFAYIRRHPRIGHDILKDIPAFQPVLPGVLYHHERWDGSGYPDGLRGDQIPLLARVLALADAFDAMSSNRAYRPAMSRERVFQEIRSCSGTQFDPRLANLFLELDFSGFDKLLAKQQVQARRAA